MKQKGHDWFACPIDIQRAFSPPQKGRGTLTLELSETLILIILAVLAVLHDSKSSMIMKTQMISCGSSIKGLPAKKKYKRDGPASPANHLRLKSPRAHRSPSLEKPMNYEEPSNGKPAFLSRLFQTLGNGLHLLKKKVENCNIQEKNLELMTVFFHKIICAHNL